MRKAIRWISTVLAIMMVCASLSAQITGNCNVVCEASYDTASCLPHFYDGLGDYDDTCWADCAFFGGDGGLWPGLTICYCTGDRCAWV